VDVLLHSILVQKRAAALSIWFGQYRSSGDWVTLLMVYPALIPVLMFHGPQPNPGTPGI